MHLLEILILLFIIWKVISFIYHRSKAARHLTLLYSMRHKGPNSFQTIAALDNVVRDMLKKDGVQVDKLDIVHEIGNRYQAVLKSCGKTYDLSITADRAGNVQYRIN